ncbi:methyltransferase [Motilimonas pumila]|uniref:Methyltransferase n=1 Tax=Motilimonas pumila TaxID=2303987 RepID=A0A418YCK7_9GAMM|nr:methyltransferase [Motilimonas pumila]RJG42211.1 methyltransferase [Motilimonas pumila]
MTDAELEILFQQLDTCLYQHRALWQFAPFAQDDVPWQATYPALYQALSALSDEDIAQISTIDDAVSPWLESLSDLKALYQSPLLRHSSHQPDTTDVPFWLMQGVKGRKQDQIARFVSALPTNAGQSHLLEWCAGKGHLGRLAAFDRRQACTSLEWQSDLCDDGQALSAKLDIAQEFVHLDVLKQSVGPFIQPHSGVMALHACGQLHQRCIDETVKANAAWLTLSPCCYHLISGEHYQGMSQAAKASRLTLCKLDLKLPLQQLVTGGERQRLLREKELLWRLAFSHYCQLTQVAQGYVSLPNFPKILLSGNYSDFVSWAIAAKAKSKQPLALTFVPELLELSLRVGQQQQGMLARIEVVRQLFRRPLELWLLLDKALFLKQHGYHIRLNTFCDFNVTPRNYLLIAQRQSLPPC